MSHEPTEKELLNAGLAVGNFQSEDNIRISIALTAANTLRDKRIRNEALEEAARDIDCGCAERDAVLAAKTRTDRGFACSHSECCAELAADIRALKDKTDE